MTVLRPTFVRNVAAALLLAAIWVVPVMAMEDNAVVPANAPATVLERVRQTGAVTCAVDLTPGFSAQDAEGRPRGFEVDLCRAVAAAALGDAERVRVRRVSTKNKFEALTRGEIDIAFGMATWTYQRDTLLGTRFPAVTWYDGQGLMSWGPPPASLNGVSLCVQAGTTSARNLSDWLAGRKDQPKLVSVATSEEKWDAFSQRRCTVVTGDRSELAVQRAQIAPKAAQAGEGWTLWPDVLSREPLGAAVSASDPQWFAIVRWAILATVVAEARGVTQTQARGTAPAAETLDGELKRLYGLEPGFGAGLGLQDDWARQVIAGVGNYEEIFTRSLAPLGLERGENALWRDGGLMYAPPLR